MTKQEALVAIGITVYPALEAAALLKERGIRAAVVNARFVKPLDRDLLKAQLEQLGLPGARLATVEEHVVAGGFGAATLETISELGLDGVETLVVGVPDKFVPHGSQDVLRKTLGLDAESLFFRFRTFFGAGLRGAEKPLERSRPTAAGTTAS
jgi:1-deoxy-D-xylulose-5-phosphate synthase